MIVHLFNSYTEALQAIQQLNEHHGFPAIEGGTCFSESDIFKHLNQWFIIYHPEYTNILRETVEIELPTQNSIE